MVSIHALSASLPDIEALLGRADYGLAQKEISTQLEKTDLLPKARAQLYWLKALCHLSEDQTALAKESLIKLVVTDPSFDPNPNASPKVLGLFKTIASKFREKGALEHTLKTSFVPPEQIVSGEPFTLRLKIDEKNPGFKNARMELHLRPLGKSEYSALDFTKSESDIYEATIPAILTKYFENDTTFEYFIEAVSTDQSSIGTIGKSTLPLTLLVTVKSKTDLHTAEESKRNFWNAALWVGLSAAAIGGIIAIALVYSSPNEGSLRLKLYSDE
jgi:hypothetical protein